MSTASSTAQEVSGAVNATTSKHVRLTPPIAPVAAGAAHGRAPLFLPELFMVAYVSGILLTDPMLTPNGSTHQVIKYLTSAPM